MVLRHLVCDLNGTLALDGQVRVATRERLERLANWLDICVLTADTLGMAAQALKGIPVRLVTVRGEDTPSAKVEVVKELGPKSVVAIGNGRNDRLMLAEAALGIAVLGPEGASPWALAAADIVVPSIEDALDLLLLPG
ncbi:MAG: HAD family hydrolase, partial [Firmicutes bacterium]|nr:HAD family hydrolase [Bacillota bacterium]